MLGADRAGDSGGLLQPDQPPLRRHHRVLLSPIVPRDEGNRRVRVPVARHGELQATDQDACAGLYRTIDELGPEQHR